MQNLVRFFQEASKLKEKKRRGWLINGIPNPESTASHIFRLAIMAWIVGRQKHFDEEKLIKMALVHDLPEVYSFDFTPYDPLLPINPNDHKAIEPVLKKWPKLSLAMKRKKAIKKRKEEYNGLKKLTSFLPPLLGREMMGLWLEFEYGLTQEGRFVHQLDKLETFLQAGEYWQKYQKLNARVWIRWIKEVLDEPLLLEFEEAIEQKFFRGELVANKKISRALDFFDKTEKLKGMVRTGWLLRGVKNGSTVSEDSFLVALAAWVFGSLKNLDLEKILKMALSLEWPKIEVGDYTPYDNLLPEDLVKRQEMLNEWPRLPKKVKEDRFLVNYEKEKNALEKLLGSFNPQDKIFIINLWRESKKYLSREGKFISQAYWLMMFLQSLIYWQRNSSFPIAAWWQQMERFISDPFCRRFLSELSYQYSTQALSHFWEIKRRLSFFRRVVLKRS